MVVVFSILPFFSTLLGGLAALKLRHRLHPIMAFAAGILVATAVADLLPEAAALLGADAGPLLPGGATVAGFLLFSALEALVHRESWEHQHAVTDDPSTPHPHPPSDSSPSTLGIVGPLGLVVHSLTDGLAIGLAFRAGPQVGLLVSLAVLAHDFADGMNVVTLSFAGGRSTRDARVVLLLDAVAPVIGGAIGTVLQVPDKVLGVLLAVFAGVFLAIGAGHLLPEAQHQRPGASPRLIGLAAIGCVAVLVIRSILG